MFDVPMGFEPNISLGCLTFSEYPTVHPMKLQGGALRRPINPWLTNWGTFLAPMKLQVLMMSFPSIPQMFLCFLVYIYIYLICICFSWVQQLNARMFEVILPHLPSPPHLLPHWARHALRCDTKPLGPVGSQKPWLGPSSGSSSTSTAGRSFLAT